MSDSNAYHELTSDRLNSAIDVIGDARIVLQMLRDSYPSTIDDLPERVAVLEGLIRETYLAVRVQEYREGRYVG